MKKTTLLLAFLLLACVGEAWGCSCASLPDIKTKKDVEGYDFVALVKFTKIQDYKFSKNTIDYHTIANFKILELFKGNPNTNEIAIWGQGTTCEMGIAEGNTWIIFGYLTKNYLGTNVCTHSELFFERKHEVINEWHKFQQERSQELLDSLHTIYQRKEQIRSDIEIFWEDLCIFYFQCKEFAYFATLITHWLGITFI